MNQDAVNTSARPAKSKKAGMIFLLIAVVAGGAILLHQRTLKPPVGWLDDDVAGAKRQAASKGGNVVVLFVSKPPSTVGRWMRNATLSEEANTKALSDGNFVAVMVRVSPGRRASIAEEFNVTEFPTTLILTPEGKELRRAVGKIGEMPFRNEFLEGFANP